MCLWIPFKLLFSAALIDGNLGVDQQTCLFSIETQVEPATGWRLRWLTCFAVSSFWASWLFLINLNRKARACFMCWNHGPMVSLLISFLSSARGSLESQMNHWELLVEFGRHSPETPFILWLTIWLCLKIGAHHNPSKSHIHDFLMSFYRIGERVQRYMTSSPLLRVVFFEQSQVYGGVNGGKTTPGSRLMMPSVASWKTSDDAQRFGPRLGPSWQVPEVQIRKPCRTVTAEKWNFSWQWAMGQHEKHHFNICRLTSIIHRG